MSVVVKVGAAPAKGSVKVTVNGKAVKTAVLAKGKVVVTLPRLKAGKAKVVASYLGNATTKPSTAARTITVTR